MSVQSQPPSLQARLFVLVLGFALAIWLGAAMITWRDAQDQIDDLLDGHLAQAASLLLVQAAGDHDDVYDAPTQQKNAPQVAYQVFMAGELITRSANVGSEPLGPQSDGFVTVRRDDGALWRITAAHDSRHDITVMVGEQMASRQAILWAVMRSLLRPLLVAMPLFGLALWWSVRKGLAPIRGLSETLERRTPHAAEPVTLDGMPRELQPLVQTLNGLLERIGGMVQAERRFTADAAHELRTPIAAIRAQAQVAIGAHDNVAERMHALQTTLAGCDRASHLVDQLLTLARLEAAPGAKAAIVDLAAVTRRVVGELARGALERKQEVALHADGVCPVAANETLIGVLVRNLVDNAMRYSPENAIVEVAVRQEHSGAVLRVLDSGPGMTDEGISHLGERFFRVLGNDQTGSGLGWSIVRRLLDVFGARAQIGRSSELGGLSVVVHWPAIPARP